MPRLSPADRDAFILSCWRLAQVLAHKYARSCPRPYSVEDLEGEAFLGLCRAAEGFRPGAGVRFSTYAGRYITGAILEFIRSHQPGSRNAHRFHEREAAALEQLGPKATETEIAAAMEMSERDYLRWRREYLTPTQVDSLDYPTADEGGRNPLRLVDRVPDPDALTQDAIAERMDLRRALESVPPRLRRVLTLHAAGTPLHEAGRQLGVSESRAFQMEREGLRYARQALEVTA